MTNTTTVHPTIYLSPSTQDWNETALGGSEEYYMNLVADAMEPYLYASGIRFTRNTPDMTAASSIRQSNQGSYDLHLALHSNAAPEGEEGMRTGGEVYFYPSSRQGRRAAEIIAANLATIYPGTVKTVPTTRLGEVSKTKAPGVLIEFVYHDNLQDALWLEANIDNVAANVVKSLTEFFDIPFIMPAMERQGVVKVSSGWLNIRSAPSLEASIIARAWNGNPITVIGETNEGWYRVRYYGKDGFAFGEYIQL